MAALAFRATLYISLHWRCIVKKGQVGGERGGGTASSGSLP